MDVDEEKVEVDSYVYENPTMTGEPYEASSGPKSGTERWRENITRRHQGRIGRPTDVAACMADAFGSSKPTGEGPM